MRSAHCGNAAQKASKQNVFELFEDVGFSIVVIVAAFLSKTFRRACSKIKMLPALTLHYTWS
jgi:hypothetical protein